MLSVMYNLFILMLNVVMLNVVMMNVVMLNVIMLSVVALIVASIVYYLSSVFTSKAKSTFWVNSDMGWLTAIRLKWKWFIVI